MPAEIVAATEYLVGSAAGLEAADLPVYILQWYTSMTRTIRVEQTCGGYEGRGDLSMLAVVKKWSRRERDLHHSNRG